MPKILATALVAAAAAAALSACNPSAVTNAAGTHKYQAVGDTSNYTAAEQNAIESAQSYLDMGNGFSRRGLIDQLSSKAGEGFKRADAVFAVNHINVDWNQQAVESAKSYLSMGNGFSRAGLIQQLSAKSGGQFTVAQAIHAANQVGLGAAARSSASTAAKSPAAPKLTVAEQNAIQSAKSYLSMGNGFSRAGLVEQLSSSAGEGFTRADATFAVDHIKVNWDQQAVESARSYLSMGNGFSRADLIDQLSSTAGEQFSLAQATYAADKVGLR